MGEHSQDLHATYSLAQKDLSRNSPFHATKSDAMSIQDDTELQPISFTSSQCTASIPSTFTHSVNTKTQWQLSQHCHDQSQINTIETAPANAAALLYPSKIA